MRPREYINIQGNLLLTVDCNILKYLCHIFSAAPAIEQFKAGASTLWSLVMMDHNALRSLFVSSGSLTYDIFRKLYSVNWSPDGSNKRTDEEETIFCWELFIQKCSGM